MVNTGNGTGAYVRRRADLPFPPAAGLIFSLGGSLLAPREGRCPRHLVPNTAGKGPHPSASPRPAATLPLLPGTLIVLIKSY